MNNYTEVGRENTWVETANRLRNLVATGASVMLIFILYRAQNRAHDREERAPQTHRDGGESEIGGSARREEQRCFVRRLCLNRVPALLSFSIAVIPSATTP